MVPPQNTFHKTQTLSLKPPKTLKKQSKNPQNKRYKTLKNYKDRQKPLLKPVKNLIEQLIVDD
jgi:hypothetical protein